MSSKSILLTLALMLTTATLARAGGPLIIYDPATRTPYAYPPGVVPIYTDLGTNGFLTNDESDSLVARAFAQWTNVSSSYFEAAIAGEITLGGIPTDITLANVDSIVSTQGNERFNGGGIFVIYDTDGSITSNFFGAPPGVLGIGSPEFAEDLSPNLTESWLLVNGSAADPGDTSPFPGASYLSVYTHEGGHAIGLAHTQTNGAVAFFGDNAGPGGCGSLGLPDIADIETMYPFIDPSPGGAGVYQATVTHPDDIAAISNVSPEPGWPASHGTITGTIFMPDSSEVSGINVIARNLADPTADAVSALSGDFTQGLLGPDGQFTLNGLTPGAQYVVHIDAIVDGGFSTTPAAVLFFEEYWNGANESGNVDTDSVCSYVAIPAVAGVPATADIYVNFDPSALLLADDDAALVALPFSFPFCGTGYTSVWVGSNGFVTFGIGDTNPGASANALLIGAPRIAGLWADLDPTAGGVITAKEAGGNFEIKYISVPEIDFLGVFGGQPNTFTITLRPDGTHRVNYGSVIIELGALAGRSPGGGAANPGMTDLSAAPQPLGMSPGNETVYQFWDLLEYPDLSGASLEYAICGMPIAVPEPGVAPRVAGLLQSRPNPFRARTTITFDLPEPGSTRLAVFDISGRLVRTLVAEDLAAGRYSVPWAGEDDHGRSVAPGVYFYRLETPREVFTRKTLRVR